MEEILNRVAQSGIVTINLDDYFPKETISELDIKDWLFHGLILREKDFREKLETYDWEQFRGHIVTLFCSADAIIPYWAYMLMATKLKEIASDITFGNKEAFLAQHYAQTLRKIIVPDEYTDKRIVVKGCGDTLVPAAAYMELTQLLLPFAKSIMYGEPCSMVPVYKKKQVKEPI